MNGTVVKVGGSLGRGDGLPALCRRLGELGSRHALLLVPGGGIFADAVREYDLLRGLGADAAHWMAVAAMDQFGLVVAELVPDATIVTTAEAARDALSGRGVGVLLPYRWLTAADPLPHDWEVTSDAIAAWVARTCGARRLVLVKPGRALGLPLPSGRSADGCVDPEDLAGWAAVDRAFHEVAKGLEVWFVDGERLDDLERLLETGDCGAVRTRPGPP